MNAERTNQTPRHNPALSPAGGRGMRTADEHTARNEPTGDTNGDPKNDPIEEGSPTTKPCARSEMSGTAIEQSASDDIKSANGADTRLHAGPVPLFLVPQTISSEIHAHGGDISEINVRRTKQHVYAIILTRAARTGTVTKGHAGGVDGDAHAD